MDNLINIIAQAFYGNKTGTQIRPDEVDRFILGYMDASIAKFATPDRIDRTIVPIPNMENVVLVYNKIQEAERLRAKEHLFKKYKQVQKPTAVIPELDLELYSRCIVCRLNDTGELESLQESDFEGFMKYLTD